MSGTTLGEVLPKLEAFVERTRGHRFKRPVQVTVLDEKQFLAKLHGAEGQDSPSDDLAIQSTLIALHLVPTSFDYAKAESSAQDEAVGGFYDDDRMYVRSGTLNALAKVIIVHELTHALDDQWFDLTKVQEAVDNGDASLAVDSLVEGDARWVEDRFRDALPADVRREADKEESSGGGGGQEPPDALLSIDGFPYDVGSEFVGSLVKDGGIAAVDRAFRHPPVTTLQVMDPQDAYVGDNRDDGSSVSAPSYTGTRLDTDRLGTFGLSLMLSGGDPAKLFDDDTPAVWEGDRYVTFRTGGRTCLRDHLLVDDPSDEQDMLTALRGWAGRHPVTTVRVIDDDEIEFTTCVGGAGSGA